MTIKKCLLGLNLILMSYAMTGIAGTPANQMIAPTGTPLLAPTTDNAWVVGIEGLMLMPVDKFQYTQAALVQPDGSTLYHNESVDNQKSLGWGVNIGYLFGETGRDLQFTYDTIDSSDTESYSVPANTLLYGPNGRSDPLQITDGGYALGKADYDYHAADLVWGQWLNIADTIALHPFAGLRYAQIGVQGNATYNENTGIVNAFDSDSTFNGLGLRAGLDAKCALGWGFSLVGTVGGAVLVGDLEDPYKIKTNTQTPAFETVTSYQTDSHTTAIPELDESLGLDYTHALTRASLLDLQFGVRVLDYFGADQHDYLSVATTNSTVSSTDFGLHGFYLKAQVQFS